jgi:hypothetical protein
LEHAHQHSQKEFKIAALSLRSKTENTAKKEGRELAHESGGFQRRILEEPRRGVCHTRDADKEEVAIYFTGEKFFLNENLMPTLLNENT